MSFFTFIYGLISFIQNDGLVFSSMEMGPMEMTNLNVNSRLDQLTLLIKLNAFSMEILVPVIFASTHNTLDENNKNEVGAFHSTLSR